jgi:hypothetical protein
LVVTSTPIRALTLPSPSKYAWRKAAISSSGHANRMSGTAFVAEFVGTVNPSDSKNS